MATRLFKNSDSETIIAVSTEKIENYYSTFDTFYLSRDEGEIEEFEGRKYGSLDDMCRECRELFVKHFDTSIEVDEDNNAFLLTEIAEKAYLEFCEYRHDGDGEIVTSADVFRFNEDTLQFESYDISDGDAYCECFSEWDGHNFVQVTLTTSNDYCEYEEVTSDFPNWGDMLEIANTPDVQGHSNTYFLYKDEDKRDVVQENVTRWQGQRNCFEIVEDTDDIHRIVILNNSDVIAEHFPELLEIAAPNDLRCAVQKDFETGDVVNQLIFDKSKAVHVRDSETEDPTSGIEYWETENGTSVEYHWSQWQGTASLWILHDNLTFIDNYGLGLSDLIDILNK